MKYKLILRANPLTRLFSKWYAAPVNDGRISHTDIAKEISALSSLSRGDVSSLLLPCVDFGTFWIDETDSQRQNSKFNKQYQ